jgi:hypothetical protein
VRKIVTNVPTIQGHAEAATVLQEEGVEKPSNLFGLQVIPFRRGHISDTYSNILDLILDPPTRFPRSRS